MNQKYEITKLVLESQGLVVNDERIRKTIPTWWVNPRRKETGGLRLTDQGFECLQKADIKCYEVRYDETLFFSNDMIIWLDQNLNCPFYITNKKIWVFGERTAVELVLFSGNLEKYKRAKRRSKERHETS